MYKKILIPTVAFFTLGIVFMAIYSFKDISAVTETNKTEIEVSFEPVVVLELFTSQGCSSCPPADALLQKVKSKYPEKVFALSYHVDYWNYIGWEDPFSKSKFTKKQSFYNRKLGYRGNYTPEVIVNGKEHFVGSSAAKMSAKISQYGNKKALNKVEFTNVVREGNTINFDFNIEGSISGRELRAVLVLNERTTSVKRGENRNRTLTNSNIVVAENYLDFKEISGSGKIDVPALVAKNDALTLMLIAETEKRDITGAAKARI